MKPSETVLEMVRARLIQLGHDGLSSDDGECACLLDDLAPCGCITGHCESGRRVECCNDNCGNGCDFHIEPVSDAEDSHLPPAGVSGRVDQ